MSPDRNIAHSRRRPFSLAAAVVLWRVVAPLASAQSVTNPAAALTNLASTNINAALPGQIVSTNTPPLPPRQYNPDPGNPPFRTNLVVPEKIYRLNRITNSGPPPLSPGVFDPDPGSMLRPPPTRRLHFSPTKSSCRHWRRTRPCRHGWPCPAPMFMERIWK